jgi:hypothetical protein
MLLPSILRILDQEHNQWTIPEHQQPRTLPQLEGATGLQTIEREIAAAAELAKPSDVKPQPKGTPIAGPFLDELLRAITKFEKSDQSRVVDVFE